LIASHLFPYEPRAAGDPDRLRCRGLCKTPGLRRCSAATRRPQHVAQSEASPMASAALRAAASGRSSPPPPSEMSDLTRRKFHERHSMLTPSRTCPGNGRRRSSRRNETGRTCGSRRAPSVQRGPVGRPVLPRAWRPRPTAPGSRRRRRVPAAGAAPGLRSPRLSQDVDPLA
jgi:hypothetical protein